MRFYDARAAAGKLIETCRVLAGEVVRFGVYDPGDSGGNSVEVHCSLPSGYVKIAIENGHRNSEFSHEKW